MTTFEKESDLLQGQDYSNHLDRNWESGNKKIKSLDKRMSEMGNTKYEGSNEVTQARVGVDGTNHDSLNERLDDNELEVQRARGGYENLSLRETNQDNQIQTNSAGIVNAGSRANYAVDIAKQIASGSPKGTFKDANALKAKYPNGAQGIFVTQNTGHWWFYSDGWIDGGIYQGTEVADKSVDNSKLSNEVRLNGLKNGGSMSLQWSDGYVSNKAKQEVDNTPEGTIVPNSNYSLSWPVVVHTNDMLQIRAQMGHSGSMVSLWNANGEYMQSLYDGLGTDIIVNIKVPSPGYIRISNDSSKYSNDNVIFRKYSESYFESLPAELVGAVEWNRMPLSWMSRAYIGSSNNPTHKNELVQGGGLDNEQRVSELFYVAKGTILTTNAATTSYGCVLAEFSSDGKSFVRELIVGDNTTGNKSYYFDHNAYVRVHTKQSLQESVIVSTSKAGLSSLDGKTIDVLGDSYVDNMNDPIEESWHYKIAQKHKMTYNNYGLHGNGLVSPDGNGTPVVDRFSEIDSKADYVIIMSGENDYTHQLPLEDFRKGIDKIIKGVAGNCTDAKMAFFTMWSRGDTENQPIPQADYAQVMLDECKKFGVPCFNSFANSDNRVWDPDFRKKYMQGEADISHLNPKGHDRFLPRAEAFLNSL